MTTSETPTGRELDQLIREGQLKSKRILTYLPTPKEVCPRCESEAFVERKSDRGQSVRECKVCGLCYLP